MKLKHYMHNGLNIYQTNVALATVRPRFLPYHAYPT